jgi:hypothetical protein
MESIGTLALEARRLYCMFMRDYLLKTKGVVSNYGSRVIPNYDGTSVLRPRPGEAILHKYGKDYKPVWPLIAKCSIDNKVSLIELIRTQFDTSMGGPPAASACYTERAVSITNSSREAERQETHNLIMSYKKIVEVNLVNSMHLIKNSRSFLDVIVSSDVSCFFKVNSMMFMDESVDIPSSMVSTAIKDYLMRVDVYGTVIPDIIHKLFINKALSALNQERSKLLINTKSIVL